MIPEPNPHRHDLRPLDLTDGRGINRTRNLFACDVCGRVGRLEDGLVRWIPREESEQLLAPARDRRGDPLD